MEQKIINQENMDENLQEQPTNNEDTIATVKEHFQKQLEEEKKKHAEEIEKLNKQLEEEKKRHIQDIRDILTAGQISIPQGNERNQTEEELILNNMRSHFNLKGVK